MPSNEISERPQCNHGALKQRQPAYDTVLGFGGINSSQDCSRPQAQFHARLKPSTERLLNTAKRLLEDRMPRHALLGCAIPMYDELPVGRVTTCRSAAVCPACGDLSRRVARVRIGDALRIARKRGDRLALATFTAPVRGSNPGEAIDALHTAWAGTTSGARWAGQTETNFRKYVESHPATRQTQRRLGLREILGIKAWHRFTDVSISSTGWHIHLHVVLVVDAAVSDRADFLEHLHDSLGRRWRSQLERAERFRGASLENGHHSNFIFQDASETAIVEYVSKFTKPLAKRPPSGSRTPMHVLEDISCALHCSPGRRGNGETLTSDIELWLSWVDAAYGRRMVAPSTAMKELIEAGARLQDS